ncbi:MAG: corrinoid protein, partial [Clostridiales bacterium]
LQSIISAVCAGEEEQTVAACRQALANGLAPLTIIQQGLIPGIEQVGAWYQQGEYYLPELLTGARAMQEGMALLKPLIANFSDYHIGVVIIGTVQGDLHDIGKNLVAIMLESAGFKVIDLGADVTPERFIQAVTEHQADILALSALLSSTMTTMITVLKQLQQAGLRQKTKVLIGGAPLSQAFADRIGADGFAPDAAAAILIAKQLLHNH